MCKTDSYSSKKYLGTGSPNASNIADTDQRSPSLLKLATRKRLRESYTTAEENMEPNSSPVAP